MQIDCHGHFTTMPAAVKDWRSDQIAAFEEAGRRHPSDSLRITDDEIRESLEGSQLALQREYGTDVTLFSPIAGRMAHHYGDQSTSQTWARISNDLIHRACELYPENLVGVCQLPQSPNGSMDVVIEELERCISELGFVGCNLNPDPSDGYWDAPALTDEYYYPLYERMVELDVPAMLHASMSRNPAVHQTCAHYLNADTTVFVQLVFGRVFEDFPDLKFIIPHGGGAVPFHWGRFKGVADEGRRELIDQYVGRNIFFDTCVYWRQGMELLVNTVPRRAILYASEMLGAVKGIDPDTGRRYDDTRFLLDSVASLDEADRRAILGDNALEVFGRLGQVLRQRGL